MSDTRDRMQSELADLMAAAAKRGRALAPHASDAPADMRSRVALDHAEELATCLEAVTDLLSPGLALDDTGKDKLATLLSVLLRQQAAAIGTLRAALIEREST